MLVPPSARDNLHTGGATLRVWRDTAQKAKRLAARRDKQLAETVDDVIHAALQADLDREAADEAP